MKPKILLFDIDGVLVQPAGYRLATEETCRYFLDKGRITSVLPYPEIYSNFEAQLVTSEWDMVPLTLLLLFDFISETHPMPIALDTLEKVLEWTKQKQISLDFPQFETEIRKFGQYIRPGKTAAQCILETKLNGVAGDIFPHLRSPLLITDLLGNARNILACETTRKFQEFSLGGEIFKQIYNQEAENNLPSFLLTYDRSLLSEENRKKLLNELVNDGFFACVYTARPSLAPREIQADQANYSPEAELAMKLCHLENLPLIGYGKLSFLASNTGRTIPEYIKPAPVQALAAIASAWSGNEWLGLKWAANISDGNRATESAPGLPKEFELYILEDSAAGIQGGRRAAEILDSNGWKVEFHPIGISTHSEKRKALRQSGAEIFPDVNTALEAIF
jgi:hypothetical protein